MQGSNEFVEPMEVLYTTYSLSIDFSRIYKDIYDEVIKNSDFTKNYPGNAEIINQLYQDIWNNSTLNETYKYQLNNELESATQNFSNGGLRLY